MDPKTWRWRKRSSEKTIIAAEKTSSDSLTRPDGTEFPLDKELVSNISSKSLDEKDELIEKHSRAAEEAIAECKNEEAKAAFLKQELDDALLRAQTANEKSAQLETEAKECSDMLCSLREELEQRKKCFEEKLVEEEKRQALLTLENSRLCSEITGKDELIEDLRKCKSELELELNAQMTRLDSAEKENTFVKYELRMLEKEVSIRNEELEYNRRAADSAHQKNLESTRKIAKLEGECQRLRLLLQKRLLGPSDMARMKNEVRLLGGSQSETRRGRKPVEVLRGNAKIGFLMERLGDAEEENKALKELVALKDAELTASKVLNSETSSRLLELEARVYELSTGQGMELAIREPFPKEFPSSLASSSGSWANALMSELENFRTEKLENGLLSVSADRSLQEMDKLAIISVDPPNAKSSVTGISFDWLQVVLNAMIEQTQVSNRSLLELFEDISIALGFMKQSSQESGKLLPRSSSKVESKNDSEPLQISGYLTCKSSKAASASDDWSNSVRKIVKLMEGFNPESAKNSEYFVHVFQRNYSELIAVRENFLTACNAILEEKSDLEAFVGEIASGLEWIMNNDIMPKKSMSNVRDRIKNIDRIKCSIGDPIDAENKGEDRSANQPSLDQDERKRLELELKNIESARNDIEARLIKAEECIGTLTLELEATKDSKRIVEDQMETQKLINEDLNNQLSVARSKLEEIFQKISYLEAELEEKRSCCGELESTCLELQLQLESVAKQTPKHQKPVLSRTGWEITAVSLKLLECRETILNLGRQLKALSSQGEVASLENVFCRPNQGKDSKKKSSLRDRLIAENDASGPNKNMKYPDNMIVAGKENGQNLDSPNIPAQTQGSFSGMKQTKACNNIVTSLALVPSRKQPGTGFWRKLLLRRRRGSRNKSMSMSLQIT